MIIFLRYQGKEKTETVHPYLHTEIQHQRHEGHKQHEQYGFFKSEPAPYRNRPQDKRQYHRNDRCYLHNRQTVSEYARHHPDAAQEADIVYLPVYRP